MNVAQDIPDSSRLDLRLVALSYIEKKALVLSSSVAVSLCVTSSLAVALEYSNMCGVNVKLWLVGTAIRSAVIVAVKWTLEVVERRLIPSNINNGTIAGLNKMIEMLDVFGLVWFCIGESITSS